MPDRRYIPALFAVVICLSALGCMVKYRERSTVTHLDGTVEQRDISVDVPTKDADKFDFAHSPPTGDGGSSSIAWSYVRKPINHAQVAGVKYGVIIGGAFLLLAVAGVVARGFLPNFPIGAALASGLIGGACIVVSQLTPAIPVWALGVGLLAGVAFLIYVAWGWVDNRRKTNATPPKIARAIEAVRVKTAGATT